MRCKQGDSIRAGTIEGYISLLERQDFEDVRDYELSKLDAEALYDELSSDMRSKGFDIQEKPLELRSTIPKECAMGIVVQRFGDFDYVHPDTQIARIGAMFQNILILHYGDIRYVSFLVKRLKNSLGKISKAYLKPYYSGFYIQTILCHSFDDIQDIQSILNSYLDVINNQMESCKIVKISVSDRSLCNTIKPSDCNLLIGTLDRDSFKDLPERFKEWYSSSDLEIQTQDIRASIHLMLNKKKFSKDVINIKISQRGGKWVVGMYIPIGVSPYLIIKTLYPKIKLTEIYHNSEFCVTRVYKRIDKVESSDLISLESETCSCGNELVYDIVNQMVSRVCPDCQMILLMSNILGNKRIEKGGCKMAYFIYHKSDTKHCPHFECDTSVTSDCSKSACECSCSNCIHYNECTRDQLDMMKEEIWGEE